MFRRTSRFSAASLAVILSLFAVATPAAAQTIGFVTPALGAHPQMVKVAKQDASVFSCQDRPIDGTAIACRGPQQIQAAYGFSDLISHGRDGRGSTIVIVDAFSNPGIQTDLAAFDAAFGLPDPAFNIFYPDGQTAFDINDPNQVGWAAEISLDVQWAHAMAPGATIDLVLAPSNQDADLNAVTRWAVDHNLGDVISQSFGEAETAASAAAVADLHRTFEKAKRKGITVFASSGDDGADQPGDSGLVKSASWPADDPLVTGVGGTNLVLDPPTGNYMSERAWSDQFSACYPPSDFGCSGGGFSVIFDQPSYQRGISNGPVHHHGRGHGQRGVPDVSYNAGIDGGVVADFSIEGGFFVFGGTSAGSPQWAGLAAIADQVSHHRIGAINDTLYRIAHSRRLYPRAFHDVTTGNNNFVDPGFNAGTGWDAVTGLGSPNAAVLVALLAH